VNTSTIKFVVVNDPHVDAATPRMRVDDYFETIKAKLEEVREIAEEHECHAVIFTGDVFHRKESYKVSYRCTNWLIDYYKSIRESRNRRVIGIYGNHDILRRSDNWHRQPIGTVIKSGYFDLLTKENYAYFGPGGHNHQGPRVYVTGQPFYYGQDVDRKAYYWEKKPKFLEKCDYHIHVVHGTLLPKHNWFFDDDGQTLPSDILDLERRFYTSDLMVCGHIHNYYGLFGSGRTKVLNTGALSRHSFTEFSTARKMVVSLISITKGEDGAEVTFDEIPLKTAKPVDEIFNWQEVEKTKNIQKEMASFVDIVQQELADGFKIADPEKMFKVLCKQEGFTSDEVRLARDILDEVRM